MHNEQPARIDAKQQQQQISYHEPHRLLWPIRFILTSFNCHDMLFDRLDLPLFRFYAR